MKQRKVNKDLHATRVLLWISVVFLLFFAQGCGQTQELQTERAFYYWKSRLQLSDAETTALQQLNISKLYVKFFDVVKDELKENNVIPVARINIDSTTLQKLDALQIELTPVVFITNESLQYADSLFIESLAAKITGLVHIIHQKEKLKPFQELQIDCDWTTTTKENYFRLLKVIHAAMKTKDSCFTNNALLSATIRLHQVKFRNKTGVPPVDKGLLMCYNMGYLKNPFTRNSILEPSEMKNYLAGFNTYPLPLDVALPLFEWHVYFSNNLYKGITTEIKSENLSTSTGHWNSNRFIFERDTLLQNIAFKRGDVLRFEESKPEDIEQCIDFLKQNIRNKQFTVSFYHLDELLLNKHPQHELETLYQRFHD
ncbi:MAG: hypothetical protein K2X48_09525 [Chitinophagaceae bacterium]|nr:hypothetical protein [Chitinophagaceae bacterium]